MQFTFIPNLFMTMIFLLTNHPLAMTLSILMQTLLICLTASSLTQTFWFSYILFLVFLGGMLVLFIYITSLASNEMFSELLHPIMIVLMALIGLFIMGSFLDSSLLNIFSSNHDMSQCSTINLLNKETHLTLTKFYNTPTYMLTLMLVNYLFFTLIAIVKITNIFLGPLRQKL